MSFIFGNVHAVLQPEGIGACRAGTLPVPPSSSQCTPPVPAPASSSHRPGSLPAADLASHIFVENESKSQAKWGEREPKESIIVPSGKPTASSHQPGYDTPVPTPAVVSNFQWKGSMNQGCNSSRIICNGKLRTMSAPGAAGWACFSISSSPSDHHAATDRRNLS